MSVDTSRRRVVLADYGAGNLRSLASALERAGAAPVVTADPEAVREAPLAVIAGVGHGGSASAALRGRRLEEALLERAGRGRPIFGVCVGLQLLFEEHEEGGRGLGLLRGAVRRLDAPRVPHMGWNELAVLRESSLFAGLDGADVYFAHSFAAVPEEPVAVAEVEHGGRIVAAVERDAVAGVQFHPERSAGAGARLLANMLAWSRSG